MEKTEGLTALLGMHGSLASSYESSLRYSGAYKVTVVRTREEMLDLVGKKQYDCYIMDLNLGSPNCPDVTSAKAVFALVKERFESGDARFIGISGNANAVDNAKEAGIPAESTEFFRLWKWLDGKTTAPESR